MPVAMRDDRMDPMFTNLEKREAEQTSDMHPTTERGSPDEGPEGLRWALASLCPGLQGPGLHDSVGGRSEVKCGKGVGLEGEVYH